MITFFQHEHRAANGQAPPEIQGAGFVAADRVEACQTASVGCGHELGQSER